MGYRKQKFKKEQRQQAKAINFGLIYSVSPNRLVNDGIVKNQRQSAAIIKALFELYPYIKLMRKYLKKQMRQSIQKDLTQLQIRTQETNHRQWLSRKDISLKDGTLRHSTLFNQPMQGSSAYWMKAALMILKKRPEELDTELVAMIHDKVIMQPLCP